MIECVTYARDNASQGNVLVHSAIVPQGSHTIRFSNPNASAARVTIDRIVIC